MNSPAAPLSDLRVLDLSRSLSGSYCAGRLAACGADVVQVEAPGVGNSLRRLGPFLSDMPGRERSGLHGHVNCGKRSVTLDISTAAGRRMLTALAASADVVVEDLGPGGLESLGLDYDRLSRVNSRLVMTSVSNFGRSGPYRDYKASELVLSGLSGPMYINGALDRHPVKSGGRIVQFQSGLMAALLTLLATRMRDRSGLGRHVDLSTMETHGGTADRWVPVLLHYAYTGAIASRAEGIVLAGAGIVPTMDGYVNTLNPSSPSRLRKILQMIGKPEVMDSDDFPDPVSRLAAINDELLLWCLQHTNQEVLNAAAEFTVMIAPVLSQEAMRTDSHMLSRRTWVDVEHPETGLQAYSVRPSIPSATPYSVSRPAPRLGQHNREVYCGELGLSTSELEQLARIGVV